ncbi:MAG: helix-turn-helix domain-containing protein [Prevotellaceae bacterium]|jgi:AraC-like DNA-binding protein|nr:helix-turn-helix domain-containing protein [Prevotellaceae bacterium]
METKIEKLFSSVYRQWNIIMMITFAFYTVFFYYCGARFLFHLELINFSLHVSWFVILLYVPVRYISPLIIKYLIYIFITIYPSALLFWEMGQPIAFLWYVLVPFAGIMLMQMRQTIIYSSVAAATVLSVFFIVPYVPESLTLHLTENQLLIVNVATIFEVSILIIFLVSNVYKVRDTQIQHDFASPKPPALKSKEKEKEKTKEQKDSTDSKIAMREMERSQELFAKIEAYFAEKKPYTNPEFSVTDLADALETNTKYVSNAINQNALMSFNNFANSYRINMLKQMLEENKNDQYTLQHIYTSAGFNNQSTFNRIFKNMIDITPTEYIKNLEKVTKNSEKNVAKT